MFPFIGIIEKIGPNIMLVRTPLCNTMIYIFGFDPATDEPMGYSHCPN